MLRDDERRDFKRLAAETEATITRLANGREMSAQLVDLSASGCAFYTETTIESGEELVIMVPSPSERLEPLKRSARVIRVTPGDTNHLIAVEFLVEPV